MLNLKNNNTQQKTYVSLLFVVAFIWGSGFIATHIAVNAGYNAAFILLARFAIGSALCAAIFAKKIFPIHKTEFFGGALCGLSLFAGFALQTIGLKFSTPSNNAFITASSIILVPFLNRLISKERIKAKVFVGALICFLGVWILSLSKQGMSGFGIGEILTFAGAFCFACHTTCVGYFVHKIEHEKLNFIQLFTAAVISAVYFAIADRNLTQLRPTLPLLSILYLAIFSTFIAYFIQTFAQKHVAAPRAAIIISTESLFASALSVCLGYENLRWQLIVGGIMILVSIIIVELNISKKQTSMDKKQLGCQRIREKIL